MASEHTPGKSRLIELAKVGLQSMALRSPEAFADEWDAVEERFELNPHEHGGSLIKSHHVPSVQDLPELPELSSALHPDAAKCLGCQALKSVSPKKTFVSAAVVGCSQYAWLGATPVEAFKRLRRVNESLTFTIGPAPLIFLANAPGGEPMSMLVAGMHPGQYLHHWKWGKRHLTFLFGDDFLMSGGLAKHGTLPVLLLSGMLWADAIARGRAEKSPPFRVSVGERLTLKLLRSERIEDAPARQAIQKRIGGMLFARGFEVRFAGVGELQWRPGWHQTFVPGPGVEELVEGGAGGVVSHLKLAFLRWLGEQYMEDELGHHDAPRLVRAQEHKDGWYQVEED